MIRALWVTRVRRGEIAWKCRSKPYSHFAVLVNLRKNPNRASMGSAPEALPALTNAPVLDKPPGVPLHGVSQGAAREGRHKVPKRDSWTEQAQNPMVSDPSDSSGLWNSLFISKHSNHRS